MEFLQFVNAVEYVAKNKMTKEVSLEVREVTKNNGNQRVGITISERGCKISPTIYMEPFYERYQEGYSVEQAADDLITIYQRARVEGKFNVDFLKNYEHVRDRVVCKVIHQKKNREVLKQIPHMKCLNLAVVCYVLLEIPQKGNATVMVDDEIRRMWRISEEELFRNACKNTERKLPYQFARLDDMLRDISKEEVEEFCDRQPIYVLTNESRSYGAVSMLYCELLKHISEVLGQGFYVVPSSVHEVLIVPESSGFKKNELEDMLNEVNKSEVEPDEILSEKVYYYSRKADRLLL